MKKTTLYIILYFLLVCLHFGILYYFRVGHEIVFLRYYLFVTLLFMMVITIMSIFKSIDPKKIGFSFLGLVLFKLILIFIIKLKLNVTEIPHYKFHFILPYCLSLVLETLYAMQLIKGEKYQ